MLSCQNFSCHVKEWHTFFIIILIDLKLKTKCAHKIFYVIFCVKFDRWCRSIDCSCRLGQLLWYRIVSRNKMKYNSASTSNRWTGSSSLFPQHPTHLGILDFRQQLQYVHAAILGRIFVSLKPLATSNAQEPIIRFHQQKCNRVTEGRGPSVNNRAICYPGGRPSLKRPTRVNTIGRRVEIIGNKTGYLLICDM